MSLADLFDKIAAGMIYLNVHTADFPGGEIRGQLPTAADGGTCH
jgi:hypothetical protein